MKKPLQSLVALLALGSSASAASYFQNFDGFADGTTDLGDGSTMNGFANIQGGMLELTRDGAGGGGASFNIPALAGSSMGWTASFSFSIFDSPGALDPADGFSFNYGNFELSSLGGAEEGMAPDGGAVLASENLSFEIDTWQNGTIEQGVNIGQITGGVAGADLAFTNGVILNDGSTVSGLATMSWDPVNGASFSTTGLVTNANFNNLPTSFAASEDLLFGLSARIGGANQTLLIDDLAITTIPEPSGAALVGLAGIGMLLRRRR